jgi:hypothetical protein
MFGLFFYLSIYLQQILGYSPMKTGLANLPFTMTIMAVASTLSKRAATLNFKAVLTVGPLLAAAGLLYFARVPVHANYWIDILPGIVVMAAGMASVFVTATMAATSGVSHRESGLVSGLLTTGQQIGGAIGLAALTVISTSATRDKLANAFPAGDPNTINDALVYGFHHGFVAAAGFAVLASLVSLTVFKVRKPTPEEDAEQAHRARVEPATALPST